MSRLVKMFAVLFKNEGIKEEMVFVSDLVFSSVNNLIPVLFSILAENTWRPFITSCWLSSRLSIFGETIKMEIYTGIAITMIEQRIKRKAVPLFLHFFTIVRY